MEKKGKMLIKTEEFSRILRVNFERFHEKRKFSKTSHKTTK